VEKAKPQKAKLTYLGDMACPHCDKWLGVRLTEIFAPGKVVCKKCHQTILLDEKICKKVNDYNSYIRRFIGWQQKKLTIYKGYENDSR
jgi:transcription elongation factor Elf1